MDPTAVAGAPAGPAQIGFVGAGGEGVAGLFGQTAGRRLMDGGFKVHVLRPVRDNPPANDQGQPVTPTGYGPEANGYSQSSQGVINPYATLLRWEWIQFDQAVQQVAREKLVITQALLSAGLRYPLPNALGVMTLEWQQVVGDLVAAEVTMSGLTEATKDRLDFAYTNMPIPIFHKEWYYNLRHLEAARRNGRNVETDHARNATRKVSELIEQTVVSGLTIAGGNIYGLTTHPLRKTLSVTASWNTATGPQIVGDVRRMVDALALPPNFQEGPYILFIARAHKFHLEDDYNPATNNSDSILTRLQQVDGISQIIFTNRLTTGAVMVQISNDTVEIIDGLAPTIVEWDSHGGFQHNFKIFAIQLPRVRANGNSQSGIAHIS